MDGGRGNEHRVVHFRVEPFVLCSFGLRKQVFCLILLLMEAVVAEMGELVLMGHCSDE